MRSTQTENCGLISTVYTIPTTQLSELEDTRIISLLFVLIMILYWENNQNFSTNLYWDEKLKCTNLITQFSVWTELYFHTRDVCLFQMPTHCTITRFGFRAMRIDRDECDQFSNHAPLGQTHGRLARWRKWKSCDVGEAKEGLEDELWRRWSNGMYGEWAVTYVKWRKAWQMRMSCDVGEETESLENEQSS